MNLSQTLTSRLWRLGASLDFSSLDFTSTDEAAGSRRKESRSGIIIMTASSRSPGSKSARRRENKGGEGMLQPECYIWSPVRHRLLLASQPFCPVHSSYCLSIFASSAITHTHSVHQAEMWGRRVRKQKQRGHYTSSIMN